MSNKLRTFVRHPLISGSFIIFAGGILGNIFNFLFNLLMSRNLSVSDYGILTSLFSLVALLSIPAVCIAPTIVTLGGEYFSKNDSESAKSLYFKFLRFMILVGILFVIVFFIFAKPLSGFLNISSVPLVVFTSFLILISYIGSMNTTFMQAKLAFFPMSISSSVSAILKFILGFIFVIILGFGVLGGLGAYLILIFIPIIISVIVLRKVLFLKTKNNIHISSKSLISFGIPSAIVAFCLSSFISTDIILVKHLFSSQQAGLYAGMSLIGKIIYFITAPVMTVMFPLVTSRFNRNENHKNLLYLSVALVAVASLLITFFYFLFPHFTILFFLKRTEYLQISNLLALFGIFISLYSIVSLFAYYFLSIKKTKIYIPMLIGAMLQVILILIFHSTILNVIYDSLISIIIVLLMLLYYLKMATKRVLVEKKKLLR